MWGLRPCFQTSGGFFSGDKTLDQHLGASQKTQFWPHFSTFCSFFKFFKWKTKKNHILTSASSLHHPNTGQNIQQWNWNFLDAVTMQNTSPFQGIWQQIWWSIQQVHQWHWGLLSSHSLFQLHRAESQKEKFKICGSTFCKIS